MRVLLDTNALIYLLDRRAPQHIQDRLKGLLQDVERTRGQVVIPTLVVAEYLVNAGAAGKALLASLLNNRYVLVASFDHMAAEECAAMQIAANGTGNKRHPLGRDVAWQKVKVDRQVVAIAKSRGASIVADDGDIHTIAKDWGVEAMVVASLPLPDWARQLHLVGVPTSTTDKQKPSSPEGAGRTA